MTRVCSFSEVKSQVAEKTENLLKNALISFNALDKNGTLETGFCVEDTSYSLSGDLTPDKLYSINGGIYCYCTNNKVYALDDGEFTAVSSTEFDDPSLCYFKYNGQDALYISDLTSAIVITGGQTYTFSPPKSKIAVYHNGMFFSAVGRTISFNSPFDSVSYVSGLNLGNTVTVDYDFGNVVKLVTLGEELYVFCERGIEKFSAFGAETSFRFTKTENPVFDIKGDSVKKVGDKIYFLSGDYLYSFDGAKAQKIDTFLDDFDFTVSDSAVEFEGYYILPVLLKTFDNRRYLYIYNAQTNAQTFFEANNLFIADKGYLIDAFTVKLKRLCYAKSGAVCGTYWKSKPLSFGVSDAKILKEIIINASGETSVRLSGDFGIKTFRAKSGRTKLDINLLSKEFTVEILSKIKAIRVKSATAIYT